MKWTPNLENILAALSGGGVVTALVAWARHKPKDHAETKKTEAEAKKTEAEAEVALAEVIVKKTESDINLSEATMKFSLQLASQLTTTNTLNDKLRCEMAKLQNSMAEMRSSFEKQMDEIESVLQATKLECEAERQKNKILMEQINWHINGKNK